MNYLKQGSQMCENPGEVSGKGKPSKEGAKDIMSDQAAMRREKEGKEEEKGNPEKGKGDKEDSWQPNKRTIKNQNALEKPKQTILKRKDVEFDR